MGLVDDDEVNVGRAEFAEQVSGIGSRPERVEVRNENIGGEQLFASD